MCRNELVFDGFEVVNDHAAHFDRINLELVVDLRLVLAKFLNLLIEGNNLLTEGGGPDRIDRRV